MKDSLISELDAALVAASKDIRLLNRLSWGGNVEQVFLDGWRKGRPVLPDATQQPQPLDSTVEALEAIAGRCDPQHPVGGFLHDSALSYADAGRMLMAVGTPDFSRYSLRLYGRPDRVYRNQGLTPVDVARFFLKLSEELLGNPHLSETVADMSATDFAELLRVEMAGFFVHDRVEVVLDPGLASKAIAGPTRIRVRESALFSTLDKDQLLEHEAYVHSATALNGRRQTNLRSLGLGAPRTTRTQEGIAVLAELITHAIDLTRLRRIALRVIAVQMALDGADFIEVFRFFLEAGQSEEESVRSAQRIFRSGDVRGGIVFTKDSVYLKGLLEVHTFLRVAIRDNRPELIGTLFAGRLTIADTLRLAEPFASGWLQPPVYLPAWAADLRRLAAMMAYSAFVSQVKLEAVNLQSFLEMEQSLKEPA